MSPCPSSLPLIILFYSAHKLDMFSKHGRPWLGTGTSVVSPEGLSSNAFQTCASGVKTVELTVDQPSSPATQKAYGGNQVHIHDDLGRWCQRNLLSGNGEVKSCLFFIREHGCAFSRKWKGTQLSSGISSTEALGT